MDVAIVGAGPGGAVAGERLARAGFHVTLYDASHPREKPCGGGIPAGAFHRYPELSALLPLGRVHRRVKLWSPRGHLLAVDLPAPILVIPRRTLDAALLAGALAAGAHWVRERVRRVRVDSGGVSVCTAQREVRHEFVIGADGAASVVRRSLFRARPGGVASCSTAGFYVEGLSESEIVVEFLPDLPGYLWVFPRPDHASVGAVCQAGRLGGPALRARVLDFLARHYPGAGELPRNPFGASIPCPTPREAAHGRLGGPRFALLGDAAAQVDAITGEGIEHAVGSAATLSEALQQVGPERAARLYERCWSRKAGRELALAARWSARWYRPSLVEVCLSVARRSPTARGAMIDLLTVMQPYSSLRRRLLRDAWRRITAARLHSPQAA